jgi:glycine C-acetyltransferase
MDSSKNGLHNLYSKIEDMSLIERVTMYDEFLSDIRQRRHAQFARVSLTGSAPEMDVVDQYDGRVRRMIYFGSNDYLNLTNHPRLKQAAISAVERYGAGSGSVPMLGGTFDIQVKLEEKLARFKGCESAIIYTSGFGSNLGTLQCLLKKNDCAIADRLVHASLADGCAGTNIVHFKHNDMDSLESVLTETQEKFKTRIVVIDGVYSMDGDIARLDHIVELAHAHDALVMVDEAHATGVIGANGRGTPEHFNIEGKVDIVAGTLSKAVGSVGGFVCASEKLIQYIRFFPAFPFFNSDGPCHDCRRTRGHSCNRR